MDGQIRVDLSRNTSSAGPRRGRPRSERADHAILDAAGEILVTRGYAGLRLDLVAARAGVGKATVHRRFRTKASLALELLLDAAGPAVEPIVAADTRAGLGLILGDAARRLRVTALGPRLGALLGEIATNPVIGDPARATIFEPWRVGLGRVLDQGVASGELRADAEIANAIDALLGALLLRLVVGGPMDDAFVDGLVRSTIAGYATTRAAREWVTLA